MIMFIFLSYDENDEKNKSITIEIHKNVLFCLLLITNLLKLMNQ
jgi:hypothetical protein